MQLVYADPKPLSVPEPVPDFSTHKGPKIKLSTFTTPSFVKTLFKDTETRVSIDHASQKSCASTMGNVLDHFKDKLDDVLKLTHFRLAILETDDIIITRPLNELFCHVKNLKLPSLQLIARVIKTLVLSIFRWHLCDECLLKKGDQVTHSLDGRLSVSDMADFQSEHPFLLNCAFVLSLKSAISKKDDTDFDKDSLTPDTIREYFFDCYKLEITDKVQGNSIIDLFKSMQFDLTNGQDIVV